MSADDRAQAQPQKTHAARYPGKKVTARTRCGLYIERAKLVPRNQATCLTCYPRIVVSQPTIEGPS